MTTFILLSILAAADPVPKVAPEPLPPEPKSDPTNVRELYDAYRYYGLPLPPKGSYLVKHTVVRGFPVERKGKTETRYLTADEIVLITDTRSKKLYLSPSVIQPGPELFRNDFVALDNGFYARDCENWIAFAAQSYSLGWKDVAKLSFEKGLALGDYDTADGKNPILDWLKDRARDHHEQQLEKPRANRREILKAMNRAMRSPEHTYYSFGKNLIENLGSGRLVC